MTIPAGDQLPWQQTINHHCFEMTESSRVEIENEINVDIFLLDHESASKTDRVCELQKEFQNSQWKMAVRMQKKTEQKETIKQAN